MTLPNNWELKKCLWMSLAFLLAALALVWLAASGFDIPVLRQIISFIFLTFIPGILILRILRIHNINAIESLVYSVGLSLAFIMFTGLFANFILPLIGILKPISALPLVATLAIFTLILGAIAYMRDRDFTRANAVVHFGMGKTLSLSYLPLFLLPIIAILGAYLVNLYQNNFLLLFFIIVIGCVVALVAFDRFPKDAYPLVIAMIAVSFLLHVSLISLQLNGADMHVEYYFQNQVGLNGYWDFTIPHNYNTALSVVLLAPIYSLLLNMEVVWVFKIIYPLIFCLVPLVLFNIFRDQIGDKKAFLSTFFFMSMPMFVGMPMGVRNYVAQLFFALVILLMIDRKLALNQRATLAIIFAISLIVSHYASGYIFLAFLLGGWAIVALIRSPAGRKVWGWLTRKSGGLPQGLDSQGAFPHKIMAVIIGICLVSALGWYGGIAQGKALKTITRIGESQYSLLSEELPKVIQPSEPGEPGKPGKPGEPGEPRSKFLDPTAREALIGTAVGLDFASASPLGKGFRVFLYLTELFIVVGFLWMVLRPKGFKFKPEYIALGIVAALILVACIVIPKFSAYLRVQRFYHISLFLLAPFCILGGEALWHVISKLAKSVSYRLKAKRVLASSPHSGESSLVYLRFFTLAILIPFFLLNAGFFFEVTGSQQFAMNDSPSSVALSSYRLDMAVFNQEEAEAVNYLAGIIDDDTLVGADRWGRLILIDQLGGQVAQFPDSGEVPDNVYIFLRSWNVDKQEILVVVHHGVQTVFKHVNLNEMPALLDGRKLIYDNGGAQIWAPR